MKQVFRFSVLLVLVLAGLFSRSVFFVRGADGASFSVGEADVAVRRAFNATLEAERAGANVSGLIARLNEAGGLLGEAEIALSRENPSEAASKAGQCVGIAGGVRSDADALRASALNEAQAAFWGSLAFSVVVIAVSVVVLTFVWRRFKRGYLRRVLGMKPEVESDEA